MAKSIKSKRKRQMRNIKREKVYGPKELARLKKCLANAQEQNTTEDAEMVTVRKGDEVVKERMDVDNRYDKKTMTDEHGQYPEWVNQRRIKKQRTKVKTAKHIKKNKGKGKLLKW